MNTKSWVAIRSVTALTLSASVAVILAGCVVEEPVYYQTPAPRPQAVVYAQSPGGVVTVQVEPPALPSYEQPPCPEDGYIWTPGYWAWADAGYYWVPGTWVQPPRVGVYWTPGYWGYYAGSYRFNPGYWGSHVGFYGGINYGGGYIGIGYAGGRWDDRGRFAYNTAVTNVSNTVVHNTYNVTVVNNTTVNNVSYNGGPRGAAVAPTAAEIAVGRESHIAATPMQAQHVQQASQNRSLFANVNQGRPVIAATVKPAVFTGAGVVAAQPTAVGSPGSHSMGAPPVTVRAPYEARPVPEPPATPRPAGNEYRTPSAPGASTPVPGGPSNTVHSPTGPASVPPAPPRPMMNEYRAPSSVPAPASSAPVSAPPAPPRPMMNEYRAPAPAAPPANSYRPPAPPVSAPAPARAEPQAQPRPGRPERDHDGHSGH